MKHIRNFILLVVIAGMSSCGLSNFTTTNRTARSFVIETDVKQMPTVADLVVDTVYVRKDTTWTNTSKSITTKSAMRDLLIGAMMEKANADVIIQPRENVLVTTKSSKQTMHMEMYGYPARYRNFRTATEEDMRILSGAADRPVNYNTIYIGSGFQQGAVLSPVVGTPAAKEITKAPEVAKKPKYMRNKFYMSVEMGYNMFFFNTMYPSHGFLVNCTFLSRMKNPNIYEGMGLGLNATFGGKYDSDNDAREWYIPIYWHNRFYFGQKKCIPFFDFRLGAFMGVSEWNTRNNWKNKHRDFMGGLYYAAFLGLEFGKHVNVSVGSDQVFGAIVGDDLLFNLNVCAKIGINF